MDIEKEETVENILNEIITSALLVRASDIHIDPTEKYLSVFFRVDGVLRLERQFPHALHEGIMLRIKVLARLPLDDRRKPKDGKFKWFSSDGTLSAEVRVSMMPTIYGENAVFRLFDPLISILTLEELGFIDAHISIIEKAVARQSGLFIIVGPTGSGKTTTLYTLLSYIKKTSRLIVTIEDPVERHIEGIRQIEVGGSNFIEYVSILRSVLRQDPDVIMIGEIRDKVSAELAIQSALTGHLVITTLHASSVFDVKKRLVNMEIAEYLIDSTLVCALSQRLAVKICIYCKEQDGDFYKGRGCLRCGEKGISGRIVIAEILKEGESLYKDAYHKASLGLIPFFEVIRTSNA